MDTSIPTLINLTLPNECTERDDAIAMVAEYNLVTPIIDQHVIIDMRVVKHLSLSFSHALLVELKDADNICVLGGTPEQKASMARAIAHYLDCPITVMVSTVDELLDLVPDYFSQAHMEQFFQSEIEMEEEILFGEDNEILNDISSPNLSAATRTAMLGALSSRPTPVNTQDLSNYMLDATSGPKPAA